MKKSCLSCLGILFVIILLIGGGMFAYVAYYGPKLDASSKAYVEQTIPILAKDWDGNELLKRASPEYKSATTEADTAKLFANLKPRLGAFVKFDDMHGESNISYTSGAGKVTTATYKIEARFEKSKARISYTLIQHGGEWQIAGFYVTLPIDTK